MGRETGNKDMGPFKDMDPALFEAISRYRGPPYRRTIVESVESLGHYQFDKLPCTPVEMIDWIQDAIDRTPEQYRDSLLFSLNWESGYYDSGDSANLLISYERPETDEEMTARINDWVSSINRSLLSERRQYEALKAKFGP